MNAPEKVVIYQHPFTEDSRHSHALLQESAALYSGLLSTDLGSLDHNPWGKPFFPSQPDLHFSITHSGDWWLCAFSRSNLGLDLQLHRSHSALEDLSKRFFHPLEHQFLTQNGYALFYDLWCAKESWVKLNGHGFFDDPSSFSVVSQEGLFPSMAGVQFQFLPFSPGYSLCLCSEETNKLEFCSL